MKTPPCEWNTVSAQELVIWGWKVEKRQIGEGPLYKVKVLYLIQESEGRYLTCAFKRPLTE